MRVEYSCTYNIWSGSFLRPTPVRGGVSASASEIVEVAVAVAVAVGCDQDGFGW